MRKTKRNLYVDCSISIVRFRNGVGSEFPKEKPPGMSNVINLSKFTITGANPTVANVEYFIIDNSRRRNRLVLARTMSLKRLKKENFQIYELVKTLIDNFKYRFVPIYLKYPIISKKYKDYFNTHPNSVVVHITSQSDLDKLIENDIIHVSFI